MSEEKKASTEVSKTEVSKVEAEGGRIVFADEVVATIASLAVTDVDGVASLPEVWSKASLRCLAKRASPKA